ncbi:MAG TPA: hypothetical protein VLB46_18005 [Pyrinomonadaceae bacterium]|nr:hypothetical protein [Pyrinomonadaceae bacterium]
MSLRLEAILFNHDLCSATVDAFNLRKNEHDALKLPEWRRGVSINPKDSPAAYARSETQGNTITIKVDFSCDGAGEREIRARDANLHREPLNGPDLTAEEIGLFETLKLKAEGNVLGEVKAKTLVLNPGEPGLHSFDLESVRLQAVGVGKHDIVWRWQYRAVGTEDWIDFAITTHRIYTVLNLPTRPWLQDTDETQFPWVEVLEYACEWAGGAQDTDAAAELITIRLNELGQEKLICYGDGSGFYTDIDAFDCNSFLAVLSGGLGKGNSVNCDDCAAIVSTFANSVGCDLVQMCIRSNRSDFGLKPHLRIGLDRIFENTGFSHHMVAAEGCGEDVEVFDACLQIKDPGLSVFTLPVNLALSDGKSSYLSLLVVDADQPITHPHPDCKRRRLGQAIGFDEACVLRQPIEELFEFHRWKAASALGARVFISDFFFAPYIASSLELAALQESEPQAISRSIHSLWKSVSSYAGAEPFRMDLYQADSWQDAREGVMKLLASLSSPTLVRQEVEVLGDVTFADPEFENIVFAAGNLVFYLRNLCTKVGPLLDVGRRLTERIFNPPPFVIEDPFPPGTVRRFSFAESDAVVNKKISIREERPNSRTPRRLYQFLAEAGDVSRENGELMYLPESPGAHILNIYAPDEHGNAVKQTLQLFVHD